MIHFVLHRKGVHTTKLYLERFKQGGPEVRVLPYHSLSRGHTVRPGAYIFDSFERLTPRQLGAARRFWDLLSRSSLRPRLLNDPNKALLRLPLATALYEAGINDFRMFPAASPPVDLRFPVFFRLERWHTGVVGALAHDWNEFEQVRREAIARVRTLGRSATELLGVEFCETRGADGIYRKYGATVVGDRVLGRHVYFSDRWMVKELGARADPYRGSSALRDEEMAHLEEAAQADQIIDVFRLAHIDYGRIDYGLKDGRIQVWEINMNPTLFSQPEVYMKLPDDSARGFEARFTSALAALEPGAGQTGRGGTIRVSWPRRSPSEWLPAASGGLLRRVSKRSPLLRSMLMRALLSFGKGETRSAPGVRPRNRLER